MGPYTVQTDSILPDLENNTNNNAEDEVIWFSGGYYHIVYNYWHVQRGYHIMSRDGITNWTSTGLAYQGTHSPPNANSNWLRYTDGTVNQFDCDNGDAASCAEIAGGGGSGGDGGSAGGGAGGLGGAIAGGMGGGEVAGMGAVPVAAGPVARPARAQPPEA